MKIFNYGALIYLQQDDKFVGDESNFPHISELFENYEKIFSKQCFTEYLVFRQTKCIIILILVYIVTNDSFHIIASDGNYNTAYFFKLKNLLILYLNDDNKYNSGLINFKLLKIFRKLNLI